MWAFSLALAIRVSELHGLLYRIRHLRGWRSFTFSFVSEFIVKIQNPSVSHLRFEELPSHDPISLIFLDADGDEILLCPVRAVKKYLSITEQYCPACPNLSVAVCKRKKWVSRNAISFWIGSVISHYKSASEADCNAVKAKARKVLEISSFVLFRRNYAIQ